MAGSLNIADTFAGAYTGFKQGAFNDDNQWVPGLAAAQQGLFDDNSPMNDSAGYNYVEPGIPDIFKPATSSTSLPYNSDLPMYGPYNNPNPSSSTSSVFDPTVQISPAGVTSDDGMMTEPAMYLYPGEEIGIDGVPYRPDAGQTNPAYSYEPNQGGGSAAGYTPSVPEVMLSQDLSQRAPSGTMYAPDLSAYNDSSLFNYTGPGGVGEYTYGQGLRTGGADYSIFGTPTDVANPYYEGQFAPMAQTIPVGPADGAINMNPVQLPSNLPQIETSADVSMPGFVGGGNEIINNSLPSGLVPRPPATLFPSPEGSSPSLFDRQLADMSPEQIAYMNATLADQDRMQQGQIGSMPYAPAMDDTADIERGMITSQRGTTMDDTADVELGMQPPRPTAEEYKAMAQEMAAKMAIDLTPEELRDGLFIEPQFKLDENGQLVGKMGIPDAFLQDKTEIPSKYSLFMDEAQFDPSDPFVEPSEAELPLWVDKDGNYFPIYDDMGLGEPFIPTDNLEPADGPYGESLVEIYDNLAKFENKKKFEDQYTEVLKTTREFKEERDAEIKRAEKRVEKQINEARAEIQDAARRPVYTPKPAPVYTPTYDIGRRYGL